MTESTITTAPDVSGILALPQATPGAIPELSAPADHDPAAADPAAPPATAEPGVTDQAGEAFDPARHEIDRATGGGKLSRLGRWIRKRGNGARVAAGKPMAGATSHLVVPPEAAKAAGVQPTTTAPAPAAPGNVMPSGPVTVTVAPPEAPAPLGLEAYESTAVGLAHGVWACAQLAGGPKWEPTPDEVSAWSKAIQRVWHHYQMPIVGPLVELVILAFRSSAKRADSRSVRGFFAGAWRWARGGRFHDDREGKEGPQVKP